MTEERLIEFIEILRQNGLPISPGETTDAARALALVSFADRMAVRAALRGTLVKRGQDIPTFDRVFEIYFGAIGRLLDGLEETLSGVLNLEGLPQEEVEEIARGLGIGGGSGALVDAIIRGQTGALSRLLRAAALRVDFGGLANPLQRGFYARRIASQMGLPEAARGLSQIEQELRLRGLDSQLVERVSARLTASIEALEEAARRVAHLEQRSRDREAPGFADAPLHRNIATLSPAEIIRMRDVVRRLAEKLRSRLARRRRQRRRGQLNVRRTLRKNLSIGGFPAHLAFRKRRPDRPDVVLICDVSDSVRNVSRLMLQFVHALQSRYGRVRSFVFVSDLGEVTAAFKAAHVEDAVDGAIAARAINLSANSNYGNALLQFHRDFRGAVTRRTTVVVIGDGRSNYNPANTWVVGEMKQRARRVVWLCPEERSSWGFGDSEMTAYARQCHQVLVVKSVDDLARAAEQILP